MTNEPLYPAGRGQDEPRNQRRDRSGQSDMGMGSGAQHAVDSAALSAAMDRAAVLERLRTLSAHQQYELLGPSNQWELKQRFVESMDHDDVVAAVFCVVDEYDGKDRYEAKPWIFRVWIEFLLKHMPNYAEEVATEFMRMNT